MSGGATNPLLMSGSERADHGCVLSFENAQGQTLVLHRQGPPTRIVGAMCDVALSLDPSFRVTAYSSPTTIYSDMTGARMRQPSSNEGYDQECALPEKVILARCGRFEMVHPRLALLGVDERELRLGRDARARRRAR